MLVGRERVWILLDQYINDAHIDEAWFLGRLDALGRRLHSYQAPRASLHLYDLSASAQTTASSRHDQAQDAP
ncbi:MAG TPA: hypothetical protein PJ986_03580 [Gammaproteobacteria bacterium]|nr:hypothetical protein [Gammaproteobacteria bacterium]